MNLKKLFIRYKSSKYFLENLEKAPKPTNYRESYNQNISDLNVLRGK